MAFEAEQSIVAAHAQAVVGHADETAPAREDIHGEVSGLRVEGVLNQLLHDAGRALDHFASSDLISDLFGQEADAVHRRGRGSN